MSGPAIPYFARVILGRDEGFAALLSLVMLPGIILGFIVIQAIVNRIGTKQTLVATIFLLGVPMFPYGFLTPSSPGEPGDLFNLVVVVGLSIVKGFPIAGIVILPILGRENCLLRGRSQVRILVGAPVRMRLPADNRKTEGRGNKKSAEKVHSPMRSASARITSPYLCR